MSSSGEDTVWSQLQDFRSQLLSECRMKRYAAKNNGGDPVVRYSHRELRDLTGHDFQSGGEGRDAWYDHREILAWDDCLFFDAIRGRGLRFTTVEALGVKWYHELLDKQIRAYRKRYRELARAAEHHAKGNPHLKRFMAELVEEADRDFDYFVRKQRRIRNAFQDLEREGDVPRIDNGGAPEDGHTDIPEGKEPLECRECGDVWLRTVKRGRKPSTCPECS